MIVWLLGLALASDPAALRSIPDGGPALDIGLGTVSAGMHLRDHGVIGVNLRPEVLAGGWYGGSKRLIGEERPWGVDGTLSGGVDVLLQTPDLVVTGTGGLVAGVTGAHGIATLGLVVPASLGVLSVASPVLSTRLEMRLGLGFGPVSFGWRGQTGGVFWVGHVPSFVVGHGVWVNLAR